MKKKRIFIFIVLLLLVGLGTYLLVNNFGKEKVASLEVDSNLKLDVYVDGKNVGQTPYTGIYEPKIVTVKVGDYETQVNLEAQVKTIVKRNFDNSLKSLDGEIVSFEKIVGNDAILAIVTNPDMVFVKVDGNLVGESPINVNLSNGTHQLEVNENGLTSVTFPVNLVNGYKLTAVVDLSPKILPATSPAVQDLSRAMVEILATPNGFLRVRSNPDTASTEIAQVHEHEKYPLIKIDSKSGWYDIQLTASVSGWISNVYAATSSAAAN